MTIFEFTLVGSFGSILKYYGIVIILIWIIIRLTDKKNIIIVNSIMLFALWLFISFISILWSSDKSLGIYYFFAVANMVTISFMIVNINWKDEDVDRIKLLIEFSGMIYSFLMVTRKNLYHGEGIRYTLMLFGIEEDPNNIAGLLIPSSLIVLNCIVEGNKKYSIIHILALFIILTIIIMAGSRGGISALLIGIITYIILYFTRRTKIVMRSLFYYLQKPINIKKGIYFFMFVFAILVFINYIGVSINIELLNRINFKNIISNNDGGSERLSIWQTGWTVFKQTNLVGVGLGGSGVILGKGVHNQYLRILIESGIIALGLFVSAILALLYKLNKNNNILGLSIIISMLVLIFF